MNVCLSTIGGHGVVHKRLYFLKNKKGFCNVEKHIAVSVLTVPYAFVKEYKEW